MIAPFLPLSKRKLKLILQLPGMIFGGTLSSHNTFRFLAFAFLTFAFCIFFSNLYKEQISMTCWLLYEIFVNVLMFFWVFVIFFRLKKGFKALRSADFAYTEIITCR